MIFFTSITVMDKYFYFSHNKNYPFDKNFLAVRPLTLYFMPFCPLSRKIFLGIQEKGLPCEDVMEKAWAPSETLLALHKTGELPVLLHEEQVCGNDYVACEYLDEAFMDTHVCLMGLSLTQRAETRLIMSWFDRIFYQDVYWTLFYERALKRHLNKGVPDTGILRSGRQALRQCLRMIEKWTESRTYLNGCSFSWADIAGASHLSCIDYVGDIVWRDFPATKEWYMKIKSRPSFRPLWGWTFPGIEPSISYKVLDF